ncbi:DnaB-like helicase C-terminal domain-containing protein [Pseudoroseomonas cervicalis]|uniref:replicative DNA helicase n=1 Tax=Teichococcus cervicalis TaxID=204525 RepID=UPI0027880CD9|nr:DnaB-like helicase C-terminal domain-containing protein [Pseudoroseomonas cervicalis]MDQ1079708.1 replicative DNA helicase [Pseudoroseomonas cervicalis]
MISLVPELQQPRPHDIEQAVLGSLMMNQAVWHDLDGMLSAEHWSHPQHRLIWEVIDRRRRADQIADCVHVRMDLEAAGQLPDAGGAGYLASLLTAGCMRSLAVPYAGTVVNAWVSRRVVELATDAAYTACAPAEDAGVPSGRAAVEALEAGLLSLAEQLQDETPAVPLGEAVTTAIAKGREALARGGVFQGISAGYQALDRMLCGLVPGELILLAARPSMGKTALAMGIAVRAAAALRDSLGTPDAPLDHRRVLVWSGEMAADQLGARVAAAHANLSVASVFTHRQLALPEDRGGAEPPPPLNRQQEARLQAAEMETWDVPLVIDDRGGISVPRLRHRARRLRRDIKRGGLAMVVVDYVGLMRASEEARRQGRVQEISEISAGLKALARELGVPVLALSQLSRAVEGRDDKTPTLSDLRDSGALEQDADKVMFLHRAHYYLSRTMPKRTPKETPEAFDARLEGWKAMTADAKGKATIFIAKNRQGPTGHTDLRFSDHAVWFRDESEIDNSPAWRSRSGAAVTGREG